jgi:hypothetical protein
MRRSTRTRSSGTNCVPYGGSSASRSPSRPLYSHRSGERRSPRRGLPAWSNVQAPKRSWGSKPARTCCGMPAAMRSPTRGHRCNSCHTVILELIEYHSQPHAIPTKLLIYDGQGFGLVNVRQSSAVRQLPIDHAHRNTIALVCPGHGIARPTTVGVRPT